MANLQVWVFFNEIGSKAFFQVQPQILNTKYISQQTKGTYRKKFRFSIIINFTKRPSIYVDNDISPKVQANQNIHPQAKQ